MKILLSTLLLPSLLLSCGKKNDQDSEIVSATDSIVTLPQDDCDGDMIVNAKDPEPFVARLPKYEELIQFESEEKAFSPKEKFFVDEFVKDLKESGLEKTLKSSKGYHGYELPQNIQRIKSLHHISKFNIDLKTNDYNLQSFKDVTDITIPEYPQNIIGNKRIKLKINNYTFTHQDKKLSLNKLENHILNRSYKVTIIDQDVEHYYISSLLSLKDGLKKLGLDHFIDQAFVTKELLAKTHIDLIENNERLFFFRNISLAATENKLAPRTHITILVVNKNMLTVKNHKTESKKIQFENPEQKIIFRNLTELISLKIKAKQTFYEQDVKIKTENPRLPDIRLKFKVTKKIMTKSVVIEEEQLDHLFNFKLNNQIVNYNQLNNIKFFNSSQNILTISPKRKMRIFHLLEGKATHPTPSIPSSQFKKRTLSEFYELSLDFQTNTIEWNVR